MVPVLPPATLVAWNATHRTPTTSMLEVSLSFLWPYRAHGTCPLPPTLAPGPLGDLDLTLVHGYSVLQGGHNLAYRENSESGCVETVFQLDCNHFWRRKMVTCSVRSPLYRFYCLGPDWSLLQFLFNGRRRCAAAL